MNKREQLRTRVADGEDREAVRKELGLTKQVAREALDHMSKREKNMGGSKAPVSDALGYVPLPVDEAELARVRAETSAAAIELITSRRELRLFQRVERMALLAQVVDSSEESTADRLKALDLLMKAAGDYADGSRVQVNVGEQNTLVVIDNGRGS